MKIEFVVPGKPVVLKRHRVGKWGGMYDPSAKDKKGLAIIAKNALQRAKASILEGPLRYTVRFWGLRSNCDLDNGIKMADAFNGVLWIDDKQLHEIHAYRMSKDGNDRTEIVVEEMGLLEVPKIEMPKYVASSVQNG